MATSDHSTSGIPSGRHRVLLGSSECNAVCKETERLLGALRDAVVRMESANHSTAAACFGRFYDEIFEAAYRDLGFDIHYETGDGEASPPIATND